MNRLPEAGRACARLNGISLVEAPRLRRCQRPGSPADPMMIRFDDSTGVQSARACILNAVAAASAPAAVEEYALHTQRAGGEARIDIGAR